ncbi:MAG: hypothetical protein ACI9R3_002648 [Verrucomicrobiales bacterium]|jgi:hypothetical protein
MPKTASHPRLRRYGRWLLILGLLVAGFYTVEYWRGKRKWDAFRSEWEAKGENFNRPEIASIPEDQNAAKVPLMQELTDIWREHPEWFSPFSKQTTHNSGRLHRFGKDTAFRGAQKRGANMAECQLFQISGGIWGKDGTVFSADESEAAREILSKFKPYALLIDEIDAMLTRPSLALPVRDESDLDATSPPHPAALYSAVRALNLRARAHLRLNDSAAAFADLERSLIIRTLLSEESSNNFRSWQMSTSASHVIFVVIWEGMFSNAWSGAELERLQNHINEIDSAPLLLRNLRFSRAFDIETATSASKRRNYNAQQEVWRKKRSKLWANERGYSRLEPLRPQGWRYAELAERLSNWQDVLFTNADGSSNRDTVTLQMVMAAESLEPPFEIERSQFQKMLIKTADWVGIKYKPKKLRPRSLPEFGDIAPLLVQSQFGVLVSRHLASTAIALERFRIDNGHYPETLTELVPEYLADPPIDPWNGEQLLRYNIRPAARPALWSIGEGQGSDSGFIDEGNILWHYEMAPDDPQNPDRIAEREAARAMRKTEK